MTYNHLNVMLSIIEHLGRLSSGTPPLFRWLHVNPFGQRHDWNQLHMLHISIMRLGLRRNKTSTVLERIILDEESVWEFLTQGHPIQRGKGGIPVFQIVSYLTSAFDSYNVAAGSFCLLFPVIFISMLRFLNSSHSKSLVKLIDTTVTHLCNLIAFTVGDCDAHWSHFFLPLIRRSRVRFTHYSVCYLAVGSLVLSYFYTSLFATDMLNDLINQPYMYIDTLPDFFAHRHQIGLSFISAGSNFWKRQTRYGYTIEDDLRDDEIEEMKKMEELDDLEDYYRKIRHSSVISSTGHLGCSHAKMSDPLWHVKPYHCYTGYAVKRYNLIVLNPQTLSGAQFTSLRRLTRAVVESNLKRRINREVSRLYHMSSMTAHVYEPHEDALRQLDFTTMRQLLVGTVTLQAIIIVGHSFCSLLTFIKRRYYLTVYFTRC